MRKIPSEYTNDYCTDVGMWSPLFRRSPYLYISNSQSSQTTRGIQRRSLQLHKPSQTLKIQEIATVSRLDLDLGTYLNDLIQTIFWQLLLCQSDSKPSFVSASITKKKPQVQATEVFFRHKFSNLLTGMVPDPVVKKMCLKFFFMAVYLKVSEKSFKNKAVVGRINLLGQWNEVLIHQPICMKESTC